MKDVLAQARWVLRRGAYRPRHLASYARMASVAARYPDVVFLGPCFIREDVRIETRPGYGRIVIGPWVHIGAGSRLRCHEGTLRIGAKSVLGERCTINTWLDIEIGDACLIADDVYLCDFDHVTDRLDIPIKDQGIVKSPVRIGDDVWLGTDVVVTRGTRVGPGSVVGASSVVRGDFPPYSVLAGVPARKIRSRLPVEEPAAPDPTGEEPGPHEPGPYEPGAAGERTQRTERAPMGRLRVISGHEPGSPACSGTTSCPGPTICPGTASSVRPLPDEDSYGVESG